MALSSTTLRPGFLVSLKSSVHGNVTYFRTLKGTQETTEGVTIENWETEKRIIDLKEHKRATMARVAAGSTIRKVCKQTAFGLLCPETEADKLEAAIAEARKIADDFNRSSNINTVSIYVLTGKVSPDDVEAIRSINSEIRDLMTEMSKGV